MLSTTLPLKPPPKVNYLNNRDLLKEIHLSKNTYCSFRDPATDHQYDIILPSVSKINQRTIAEARRNRAARLARETGTEVNEKKIPCTDLVFRIMTWEHIPMAAKKVPKAVAKKKKSIEDILGFEELPPEDPLADLVDEPILDPVHVRVNFPPFFHYRVTDHRVPYLVGRSHWSGDVDTGEYSRDHGTMTRKLALMFMKLCERYATRSNWRGYCVDEHTQALTDRGWVSGADITTDDRILSYDGATLCWSDIKSVYRSHYHGAMHRLTNRGVDALITPGHRMVTARGLVPVEYLLQTDRIIMMADGVPTKHDARYPNAMVELLGWVVTEGNYQPKKHTVSIYQNPGAKADRIRRCLQDLRFGFAESLRRGNICFRLDRPASRRIAEILPEKNLTMGLILDLTADQREILIQTMIDGDGWRRGSGWSYVQKDPVHTDLFQALCAMSGHKTNAHHGTHRSFGKPVAYYTVHRFARHTTKMESMDQHGGHDNGRQHVGVGKLTHPNQPTEAYQGPVWCPETLHGCFMARRNGKVYLTGNTYNEEMRGQALLQLSQIGLQFDESKSSNPFAYYTAAITNSFTRVLNIEKKNQNIRDDILEMNGLNPSWTRQYSQAGTTAAASVVAIPSED